MVTDGMEGSMRAGFHLLRWMIQLHQRKRHARVLRHELIRFRNRRAHRLDEITDDRFARQRRTGTHGPNMGRPRQRDRRASRLDEIQALDCFIRILHAAIGRREWSVGPELDHESRARPAGAECAARSGQAVESTEHVALDVDRVGHLPRRVHLHRHARW